jgi:hypothetical protein
MTVKKLPKLQDFWVSDTSSDYKKNKVYQTKGIKVNFKKDKYYEGKETILLFNNDGELCPIYSYDDDFKVFDTQEEASKHNIYREQHWLDWYKNQVKEYQKKVDEYFN